MKLLTRFHRGTRAGTARSSFRFWHVALEVAKRLITPAWFNTKPNLGITHIVPVNFSLQDSPPPNNMSTSFKLNWQVNTLHEKSLSTPLHKKPFTTSHKQVNTRTFQPSRQLSVFRIKDLDFAAVIQKYWRLVVSRQEPTNATASSANWQLGLFPHKEMATSTQLDACLYHNCCFVERLLVCRNRFYKARRLYCINPIKSESFPAQTRPLRRLQSAHFSRHSINPTSLFV